MWDGISIFGENHIHYDIDFIGLRQAGKDNLR